MLSKNIFTIVLFLLSIQIKAVTVYFYYVPFYDLESKPYIETYFRIVGNSINYRQINGNYLGCAEITMVFKQEGVIKQFHKFNVSSPILVDTTKKKDFLFVHRFAIDPGIYNIEIIVKDTLDKTQKGENRFYDIINVLAFTTDIQFSGVEFLEKIDTSVNVTIYTKNGIDLIPYVSNYYPTSVKQILAYTEIYNTETIAKNEDFLIRYYISKVSKDEPFDVYHKFKKIKTSSIVPLIVSFDITNLPSGNYNLVFEVVNKENQLKAKQKVFFQRSNPKVDKKWNQVDFVSFKGSFIDVYHNIDSLIEFVKCLYPIANDVEWNKALELLKKPTENELKQYLIVFWQNRNSLEPEIEWKKYNEQVAYVQNLYGSKVKKGYESDRGRVYLKYGPPNQVIESKHEPSAYPYEIWQYYTLGNQTNRKFVFYNPTLVGNDYILLHSDARGEVYDKNWERRLSSRNNSMYNFDATESDEQYGGRAGENFNK